MIRVTLGVLIMLAATMAAANSVLSAEQQLAVQKEIDQAVWKKFKSAFENLDGEALNAIYAETVLRVTPEGLDTHNQFKQFNETRFQANIANGDRIALDFWFDSRHTNETTSYDVGFYRVGITSAQGSTTYFYGQFHIVLMNINGNWKIVQDWDTASIGGRAITAADFDRHPPIQF